VHSRRRCALCFGLNASHAIVQGQIAHLDHNPDNNAPENLAWLCLNHHDQYDSRTSQSKGLTQPEVLHYRADLYAFNEAARLALEPSGTYLVLSEDAMRLAQYLNARSNEGHKFDPQVIVSTLPAELALDVDGVELAVDELIDLGLIESSGMRDRIYATNRLFWETDAIFTENDPALDAQDVARAIVAFEHDFPLSKELADILGWPPRRINPAVTYLADTGVVGERATLGSAPYWLYGVVRSSKTKRYVRDLGPKPGAA
jgi:hypothetical protein